MYSDIDMVLKTYDLFITKVDVNNVIKAYSIYEEKYNMNIECILHLKVECVEPLDYANNYKLVDGALVELTEEEKPIEKPPVDKVEVLEKRVKYLEEENKLLNKENKLLHEQVKALDITSDFHEELITEMAMKVYA